MLDLNAQDRCDRCGAQAKARAKKPGMQLLLCTHHMREHRDALLNTYWLIEPDESPAAPVPATAYTE